jgi:FkbM family methyltransferase
MDEVLTKLDLALSALNSIQNHYQELETNVLKKDLLHPKSILSMSLRDFAVACRRLCQTVYLGDDTILCRVLGRYLVYADTKDSGIAPHLCLDGYWESWLTYTIVRTIQPNWYCLDIGANHGYYSLLMGTIAGPSGRVISLEPNLKLVKLLRKTLEVNGLLSWTTVLANAASDTSGKKVKLTVPDGNHGGASICRNAIETDTVYEVETVTVDELTETWPQVNFIKIDTEGAEEQIWQGMQQTISRNKDIILTLEFSTNRYPDPEAFLKSIQEHGFILRYIDYTSELKEVTLDQCLKECASEHKDLFLSRS